MNVSKPCTKIHCTFPRAALKVTGETKVRWTCRYVSCQNEKAANQKLSRLMKHKMRSKLCLLTFVLTLFARLTVCALSRKRHLNFFQTSNAWQCLSSQHKQNALTLLMPAAIESVLDKHRVVELQMMVFEKNVQTPGKFPDFFRSTYQLTWRKSTKV